MFCATLFVLNKQTVDLCSKKSEISEYKNVHAFLGRFVFNTDVGGLYIKALYTDHDKNMCELF